MGTELSFLEQIEEIATADESRRARAERIAQAIRELGQFRWVGVYDVDLAKGQVVNLAWSGHFKRRSLQPVRQRWTSFHPSTCRSSRCRDYALSSPGWVW